VRTAARVVTASPLKITLVPVWAAGPDELNPLYVSPASGRPSQMLAAVGGGEKGVRFSDGCGGALAVDSAGLTVTALQITPQCTVRASVGNFTELQSPSFGITSRENATD
jgi:serine/threonine-protein kinase